MSEDSYLSYCYTIGERGVIYMRKRLPDSKERVVLFKRRWKLKKSELTYR